MVGKGTPEAMLSKAFTEGIDVLAMFEVRVTKNTRTGLVLNKVGLTFLDVRRAISNPRGAVIHTAASIDNLAVQRKRDGKNAGKKGKNTKKKSDKLAADDPVTIAVDRIFSEVDRKVKMANFPSLTEGVVREYVLGTLVASVPKDPVPVLAEVKLYHHMRLMTDDTLVEAYKQLIQVPDLAEQLAKGSQEQQLKVLETFLPELPKKEDPKKKNANGASVPVNAQGNGGQGGPKKKANKKQKAGGFLDGLKAAIGNAQK